jgi:hypothetical protein
MWPGTENMRAKLQKVNYCRDYQPPLDRCARMWETNAPTTMLQAETL